MLRRTHLLAGALVCATLLAHAPAAGAHAQLLGTSPLSGAVVARQPQEVIFKFNQAVGGTLGAVRVYDARGDEVDNLDVSHPDGREHWMGVGLKQGLPDGTYTATYRVISADTHIVYGGVVFSIGHAGPAPKVTVAGLISRNESGRATKIAFGAIRALDYVSLALFIGGLAFLLLAWLPGLTAIVGEPRASWGSRASWAAASRAFTARLRKLLLAAVALGLIVSVLGILLQGASAAGVSLWSSLKGTVIESTLESRFGEVWGARGIVWLALGGLLLATGARRRKAAPVGELPAPATDGAPAPDEPDLDGAPLSRTLACDLAGEPASSPRWVLGLLGLGGACLAITPALSGHASVQGPTGVFFPADVVHVLGASVWVGGIACLLLALPAATRELARPDRSRLLLAVLARFSPLALASVIAIAITGVVQAYIDVRSVEALLHTTYGTLILIKVALLGALIGLGWVNRERVIPALRRIVQDDGSPGQTGALARRTMRGEIALMLTVLGVTAALVSYAPPIDAASGPFATNTTLGPIELEMTVEPAKVGLNTAHLYLIDATDGAQYTGTKELVVTARLPAKGIGPLPLHPTLAGPGHYILSSAVLSPGGMWQIQITDRVSEFQEYARTVNVPIR
jgi:copper transport protein